MPFTLDIVGHPLLLKRDQLSPRAHRPRHRRDDDILDSCWCADDIDLLALDSAMKRFLPSVRTRIDIRIAGKSESPDPDALGLAFRVLASPSAAFAPLLAEWPDFNNDPNAESDWQLSTLWFPYQVYRPCWFASFRSDYGGDLTSGFMPAGIDLAHAVVDPSSCNSFTQSPWTVSLCISKLLGLNVVNENFAALLNRIDQDCLFGAELLAPLSLIVKECQHQLPPSDYENLLLRLQQAQQKL